MYEKIQFAEPVINQKIEAKTLADRERLIAALEKLVEEDPTLKFNTDEESGELILCGVGELHLEIIVDRLKREFNLLARVGKPQVSYRETVTDTIQQEGKIERQLGDKKQFGHVILKIEPAKRGEGLIYQNLLNENQIPKQYYPAIEKGIKESLQVGPKGYPVIDLKVTVIGGSYSEESSTELAYIFSASQAIREGISKATPVLLEPFFEVEIVSPEDYVGDIIADFNSRRGKIESINQQGVMQVVKGSAPLSEMFGYVTTLRSLSQGRAVYTMIFSHYEQGVLEDKRQKTEDRR